MAVNGKNKVIDLNRTLYDLTEEYPELIKVFSDLGLAGAGNALLRKTLGRKVTIKEGIERNDLSLTEVKQRLEKEGFTVEDERRARRETLKEIIRDIHRQKSPEELKERFRDLISDVGATEIAQLEQELIQEGLPESEVKSLCDVHVAVFQEGLEKQERPEEQGGHPVHTFRKENGALTELIGKYKPVLERVLAASSADEMHKLVQEWQELHRQLSEIEKHYSRKENILFAYLEKHGVSGPPKVMWAIHDDIREQLKEVRNTLTEVGDINVTALHNVAERTAQPMLKAIEDMIYKEENILFPMSLETLTEWEWAAVAEQSADIGYALIEPDQGWTASVPPEPIAPGTYLKPSTEAGDTLDAGAEAESVKPLAFETGVLTPEQISLIFNHLPVDITYVDEHNSVRYFSLGKERIFQRSKAIIGRQVQNCHPPDSVHIVNRIVEDFRSGKRDAAHFWIQLGGKFVYIQYFAVRDQEGRYRGVVEVTQDVQEIRQLEGEKRIYSEE